IDRTLFGQRRSKLGLFMVAYTGLVKEPNRNSGVGLDWSSDTRVRVQTRTSVPVRDQLRSMLAEEIARGSHASGSKLPSERELAAAYALRGPPCGRRSKRWPRRVFCSGQWARARLVPQPKRGAGNEPALWRSSSAKASFSSYRPGSTASCSAPGNPVRKTAARCCSTPSRRTSWILKKGSMDASSSAARQGVCWTGYAAQACLWCWRIPCFWAIPTARSASITPAACGDLSLRPRPPPDRIHRIPEFGEVRGLLAVAGDTRAALPAVLRGV